MVSLGINTLVVCIELEDLHEGDGFYDSICDLVPWLSESFLALIYLLSVCRCWRFVLGPVVVEAPLKFAWCTWFFMVCGDGFLHGVWRWLHLEDS